MSTATVTQPEALWVELHEACGRYGNEFGTGHGWWTNSGLAVYLGKAAKATTHWESECDCSREDVSACCSYDERHIACDYDHCQEQAYYRVIKDWDVRAVLAQIPTGSPVAADLGPKRRDWVGVEGLVFFDHVPVLVEGVERFTVDPELLDAGLRYGYPTHWQVAHLKLGDCLIGYQGENIVILLMPEVMKPGTHIHHTEIIGC